MLWEYNDTIIVQYGDYLYTAKIIDFPRGRRRGDCFEFMVECEDNNKFYDVAIQSGGRGFVYYDETESGGKVLGLLKDGKILTFDEEDGFDYLGERLWYYKPEYIIRNGTYLDNVICLDIETTRSNGSTFTIEIGMVRLHFDNQFNMQIDEDDLFSTLIKPPEGYKITNFYDIRVHKIKNKDVQNAPTLKETAPNIVDFITNGQKCPKTIVVCHKIGSEYTLFEELAKLGYGANVRFFDTMAMAKQFSELLSAVPDKYVSDNERNLINLNNNKLQDLTECFNFKIPKPHRALDDAFGCAHLYRSIFYELHIATCDDFLLPKNQPFIYDKHWSPHYNTSFEDDNHQPTLKSRVSEKELEEYLSLWSSTAPKKIAKWLRLCIEANETKGKHYAKRNRI